MKKVLMHVCCAPCFITIQEDMELNGMLIDGVREKVDLTAFWYNPNIHTREEYENRKASFIKFCEMKNVKNIIIDECDMLGFINEVVTNVGEFKKWSNRCEYCYTRRLEETFKYASQNGYDIVSTTLTRSPYQNHELINKVAEGLSRKYNVKYVYSDYRHTYYEGQRKAREYGIYMQKYCGCIFSENSRYKELKEVKLKVIDNTNMSNVQIKKIEDKEKYIDMMLEADPSRKMIDEYLKESNVYALTVDGNVVTIAVILPIDKKTLELKNLATKEEYQNKGYASKLIKLICGNMKQKYDKFAVGTTENNIPFYVKQGFDHYEKTIKNYFIDNYEEKVKDGDLICTDIFYYSMNLKK